MDFFYEQAEEPVWSLEIARNISMDQDQTVVREKISEESIDRPRTVIERKLLIPRKKEPQFSPKPKLPSIAAITTDKDTAAARIYWEQSGQLKERKRKESDRCGCPLAKAKEKAATNLLNETLKELRFTKCPIECGNEQIECNPGYDEDLLDQALDAIKVRFYKKNSQGLARILTREQNDLNTTLGNISLIPDSEAVTESILKSYRERVEEIEAIKQDLDDLSRVEEDEECE